MTTRRKLGMLIAASGIALGGRAGCTFYETGGVKQAADDVDDGPTSVPQSLPKHELPYFGRYYGGYPIGRGVGNTNLRVSTELGVSNFFYADRSDVVTHFRYQKRYGPGYSEGDLGRYTVRIVEADARSKLPLSNGRIISQIEDYEPGFEAGSGQYFHTAEFASKGRLVVKRAYCFVWINTHPRPESNFFAQNNDIQYQWIPPEHPGSEDPGEAFWNPARIEIDGEDRPWFPYPITAYNGKLRWGRCGPPLIEFRYANGQWSGWGSWGSPYVIDNYLVRFDQSRQIRERFRVSRATRTVKSVWLNLWRIEGGQSDLVISLERGPDALNKGNGEVLEEVRVPARNIHDGGRSFERDDDKYDPDLVPWIEARFQQNHELEIGQIYSLRLRTEGSVMEMTSGTRAEQQKLSPKHDDFDEHEAGRRLSWLTFDDSMGMQETHNSGINWGWSGNRHQMACLFECV